MTENFEYYRIPSGSSFYYSPYPPTEPVDDMLAEETFGLEDIFKIPSDDEMTGNLIFSGEITSTGPITVSNLPTLSSPLTVCDTFKITVVSKKITVSYHNSLEELNECIAGNDFEKIIADTDLFFMAFCKALDPHQVDPCGDYFKVIINEKQIQCSGEDLELISETIEKIRTLFAANLPTRENIELLSIWRPVDNIDLYKGPQKLFKYYQEEAFDLRNCLGIFGSRTYLSQNEYVEDRSTSPYDAFIIPSLPTLATYCGTSFSKDVFHDVHGETIVLRDLLSFAWTSPQTSASPVTPSSSWVPGWVRSWITG